MLKQCYRRMQGVDMRTEEKQWTTHEQLWIKIVIKWEHKACANLLCSTSRILWKQGKIRYIFNLMPFLQFSLLKKSWAIYKQAGYASAQLWYFFRHIGEETPQVKFAPPHCSRQPFLCLHVLFETCCLIDLPLIPVWLLHKGMSSETQPKAF